MLTYARLRHCVPIAARLLVSAFLLVFLVRRFNIAQFQNVLQRADFTLIGAAAFTLALSPATSLPRWSAILRQLNHPLGSRTLSRFLYVGAFFSQMLPSTVGGDVWRIWACYRAGVPVATATHSILLDRLAGVTVIFMFFVATSPLLIVRIGIDVESLARWGTLVVAVAAVFVGLAAVARGRTQRLPAVFVGFGAALMAVAHSPRTIWLMLITATAGQLVAVLAMDLLNRSIGGPLSFMDCVVTLAPALLIAMVPISLGGWGVREGAFVILLHFYGVPREQALTLSVLFGLTLLGGSLVGLPLWLWHPAIRISSEPTPNLGAKRLESQDV